MIHLITGGSGSGKSSYAEDSILRYYYAENPSGNALYYIATMEPYGDETQKKIQRHRRMRAGKGFQTIECYTGLWEKVDLLKGAHPGVLLDCISNLIGNELYYGFASIENEAEEEAEVQISEHIWQGIVALCRACDHIVIVNNEVCSECTEDSVEMLRYKRVHSNINRKIAAMADRVTEVVYGIPVELK